MRSSRFQRVRTSSRTSASDRAVMLPVRESKAEKSARWPRYQWSRSASVGSGTRTVAVSRAAQRNFHAGPASESRSVANSPRRSRSS